ncbi:hypothetical protein CP556_05175 [Natrinema sp. CBA1119]|uniref:DUF7312 domain-containing protein n=1 Tax=Natrinema sp. CBA1119 TaxID=1608465 RepID=UPI000BF74D36|nr:hypothetical protein [Natrinema sp. CBA1119]PGF15572.1 hypothetical protein CP556_05175 [Natrinema sp. CBA1119]
MSDESSRSGDEWGASGDDDWGDPDRLDRPDNDDQTGRGDGDQPTRDDRDEGWDRIPIDLSGGSDDRDTDEADAFEDDEYGPEASSTPIEGGDPDLENALFVLLGAVAMMLVIVRLVLIIV